MRITAEGIKYHLYHLSALIFALLPYVLVAWGYKQLTNGGTEDFWSALGVLFGVRLFFFVIERLGDVLSWRVFRRRTAVNSALTFLKANEYPPRKVGDTDFIDYLQSIQRDPVYPESLRTSAYGMYQALVTVEGIGITIGARSWDVWDTALEIYTPKAKETITE